MNARTHFVCTVDGCGKPHDARGFCREHYKRFRRCGDAKAPPSRGANGSGWTQRGYKFHTVDGRHKPEHQTVAERALGKSLPAGAVIHHVDENRFNNAPTNLVICPSNYYHRLIHQRLNAYKASGHFDWRKCPYCRTYDDPANMRGEKSGRYVHAACSARARRKERNDVHI